MQVSKFIKNLGKESDLEITKLDNKYIEALSISEKKELAEIADNAY